MVIDVHGGGVMDGQMAGAGPQPHEARPVDGVGINHRQQLRTDLQGLTDYRLMRRLCRMNVENEIAGLIGDVVLQVDGQIEPDHCSAASSNVICGR
jgi:hypothetical protein